MAALQLGLVILVMPYEGSLAQMAAWQDGAGYSGGIGVQVQD